jgi:hypothetical protein
MEWCPALTTSASGADGEHLSKLASETDKPLHAYRLLVFMAEGRTDANQVIFQHGVSANSIRGLALRGVFFYDIHAIFKNIGFGNLEAPVSKCCEHGKG